MFEIELIMESAFLLIEKLFPSIIAVLDDYVGGELVSYILIISKILVMTCLIGRMSYFYFIQNQVYNVVNIYIKLVCTLIILVLLLLDIYRLTQKNT